MKQNKILIWLFILSAFIGLSWNSFPLIKDSVHSLFDPVLGTLLNWNLLYGMLLLILLINVVLIFLQKYVTDQESLKSLKKEQKEFQKDLQQYKDDPAKMIEMNKKQWEFFKETFTLSMRPTLFTLIPFVLLFRWFQDYFLQPALEGFKFLGLLSWFWFYLITSILFSIALRKTFDVA